MFAFGVEEERILCYGPFTVREFSRTIVSSDYASAMQVQTDSLFA